MTKPTKSPSISIRRGIAFGFSPPYEDTDTLVLTSPAGRFVDIRFPLLSNSPTDHNSSSTARPGYMQHHSFWAFSGRSSSTKPQKGEFPAWPCASHCVWTHEIDSNGEGMRDEGDMFDLANGDFMEVGVMRDADGRERVYKEYWTSPEGEGVLPCLVAEVVGDEKGDAVAGVEGEGKLRGRIVRVGRHCQSIVEAANGGAGTYAVRVERWTYKDGERSLGWVREEPGREEVALDVSRNGDSSPHAWLLGEERQLGDEMVEGGQSVGVRRWRIVEYVQQQS